MSLSGKIGQWIKKTGNKHVNKSINNVKLSNAWIKYIDDEDYDDDEVILDDFELIVTEFIRDIFDINNKMDIKNYLIYFNEIKNKSLNEPFNDKIISLNSNSSTDVINNTFVEPKIKKNKTKKKGFTLFRSKSSNDGFDTEQKPKKLKKNTTSCNPCFKIKRCKSIHNIEIIIKKHHKNIAKCKNLSSMMKYVFIKKKYTYDDLMNDWIHLKDYHLRNDKSKKAVIEYVNLKCEYESKCGILKQNRNLIKHKSLKQAKSMTFHKSRSNVFKLTNNKSLDIKTTIKNEYKHYDKNLQNKLINVNTKFLKKNKSQYLDPYYEDYCKPEPFTKDLDKFEAIKEKLIHLHVFFMHENDCKIQKSFVKMHRQQSSRFCSDFDDDSFDTQKRILQAEPIDALQPAESTPTGFGGGDAILSNAFIKDPAATVYVKSKAINDNNGKSVAFTDIDWNLTNDYNDDNDSDNMNRALSIETIKTIDTLSEDETSEPTVNTILPPPLFRHKTSGGPQKTNNALLRNTLQKQGSIQISQHIKKQQSFRLSRTLSKSLSLKPQQTNINYDFDKVLSFGFPFTIPEREARFKNIKQEVIENQYEQLSRQQWNICLNKTKSLANSNQYR